MHTAGAVSARRGANLHEVQALVDRVALISGKRTVLRHLRIEGCTAAAEGRAEGTVEGIDGAADAVSATKAFQVYPQPPIGIAPNNGTLGI